MIQTQAVGAPVGWASGRVNVLISAPTKAVQNARIQVIQGALQGCSTDNFTIRPAAFTISSTANNNTPGAGTTVNTDANFSITATPVQSDLATAITVGYVTVAGTPSITPPVIISAPLTAVGTLSGSFPAAAGGATTGATFTYSEVGNFGLSANAVSDTTFTAVDQSSDCVSGSFSNVLAGGQYGCSIGSTAVPQTAGTSGFGRFIPDHFFLAAGSTLTNRQAAACAPASTFSYLGEGMAFAFTLQARNSSGTVTQNYAGAYAKLVPGTIAQFGFGALNGATNLTSRLDLSAGSASVSGFVLGQAAVTATVGIARAASPDGPFTTAKLGIAPSDSDLVTARTVDMNMDVDGVGGNDHVQVGANTELRFGRLNLLPATGAAFLPLTIPIRTEYWNGTGFVTNAADSCTTLSQANIPLGPYTTPLAACATRVSNGTAAAPPQTITFTNGIGRMQLDAPGVLNSGSVVLTANLGNAAIGNYCKTVGGGTTADTGAILSYLQGAWNGIATYNQNPAARAGFGVYGTQPAPLIFYRENY